MRTVFGWTFTVNSQTHKDVYLLHPVTQNIVSKTFCVVQRIAQDAQKLRNLENL